ncbi:MAG: error-prone DNA polymerase [candidate division Zixibacteria bacterium]|jgi:error-prone DNA polymerase|nr:error-prone DNA polymerase [candidate division Zixibacteria bacterium]
MAGVSSYIELHCHSNFSFLDGADHPETLIVRAADLGYAALALTDHNGLYGAVRFHKAAQAAGVKAIIGAELTLDNGHHLVVLVETQQGYGNLSQMLSEAQLAGKKGEASVSYEMLERYHGGLIALSGCVQGEVPSLLVCGREDEAAKRAKYYRDLFGEGRFYFELQHHNLPVHEFLCAKLVELGESLGIPPVATNNVHYATADGRRLADVLACIKHHTTLDEAGEVLYPNAERYLKPPEAVVRQLARYPEAIANTVRIAERCEFSMDRIHPVLPDFEVPSGETTFSYLRKLTYAGARSRYGRLGDKVVRQLQHELRIIRKLDFSGYFLIVWDIARFCRDSGILSQGRGSAANSAVCYCLGITAVDPIRLELLFERFLSEHRREPPDIDIDIANNRREEVIQYVYAKYGRRHASMVCEVITYRGRSAIRDVGKALGFSPSEVDRLAKHLDSYSRGEEMAERLQEATINVNDRRVQLLLDLCAQIRRFPRHLGIHVGGMLITKTPLSQIVPVENATMPDRSVIQWDKDDAQDMGLVKIDLLGLGMLSLMDIAFRLIERHHGIGIDPARLTYDDPRVYDLLCTADTVGVFQVESRAQMNTLPRHKPRRFYDLVVEVALIRPGPIQGDMVHPYLRRRNGEEPVTYPHPRLKRILQRTLGVPLFQEQGMQVAVAAAGFTPSEADELRRAMGHKRSRERMEELSTRLIAGMVARGIDEESAWKIFNQLAAFADFGFTESHAASFALLVYVSAYLKVYFPAEFYCALLNAQPMGFYTPSTVVYEAQRRGVEILGVDVSRSEWDCRIENGAVRLGFRYVKSLGPSAQGAIEEALAGGPFHTIDDFVFRTKLDRDALEQIAMIGGFDCFGTSRRQALWRVLALINRSADELQMSFMEEGERKLSPMETLERLAADFKGMNLSNGPHPMTLIRDRLRRKRVFAAGELNGLSNYSSAIVAGVVVIRQRPVTAKGFIFITLEDETGFANIVVKPAIMKRFRRIIIFSRALLVQGTLEKKDGVINIIAHRLYPLEFESRAVQVKSRDFR